MTPTRPKKKASRGYAGYRDNDPNETRRGAQKRGGGFDNPLEGDVRVWTPSEGKHTIRILPRTWEGDPKHWAYEAFFHYSIGPDNASYFCLDRMKNEACPICEERAKLAADGDEDGAQQIRPVLTKLCYIIDRRAEDEGPMIWKMPAASVHSEICDRSEDSSTGELLKIDHPDDGYDITFKREGTMLTTRYKSVDIARNPSALSDNDDDYNDWLDKIEAQPIPSLFKFYDYDYILRVFGGKAASSKARGRDDDDDDEDDEEDTPPPRTRRSRSRPAAEDERKIEDLDEDDEDDEDEDEAPADLRTSVDKGLRRRRRS